VIGYVVFSYTYTNPRLVHTYKPYVLVFCISESKWLSKWFDLL